MEIILFNIFIVIFISFISSCYIYFIDFCFNDGNIFDWYYKILLQLETKYPKLVKPLGLCPICFGFWFNLIFFTLVNLLFFKISFFYIIFSIGINSFINMKIFKI
jgi:hypothetical protein